MLSKAKVALCSDIRTKHSTQSDHHVTFFNVKPWWYVKKPLGFKRLIFSKQNLMRITILLRSSSSHFFTCRAKENIPKRTQIL